MQMNDMYHQLVLKYPYPLNPADLSMEKQLDMNKAMQDSSFQCRSENQIWADKAKQYAATVIASVIDTFGEE